MGILRAIQLDVRRIQRKAALGGLPLGLPELDRQAFEHGRARLAGLGDAASAAGGIGNGPDVYLASTLFRQGGHTALIGDMVRARAGRGHDAHLIVTGATRGAVPTGDEARSRIALPPECVTEIAAASLDERLGLVLRRLAELRPGRLLLVHHADDAVAVAAAQPALAPACLVVHHADAAPSLGLHVPGVRVIELNPFAGTMARLQRLDFDLLLLTCPDPGPRPAGFRRDGGFVTASAGPQHKFEGPHRHGYPAVVACVLRTTAGRHVHIGPLDDAALAAVRAALAAAGIAADRFVHHAWVPSVARTLWDVGCDLFLASFPADGARTMVEVAASGTPYLTHARTPSGRGRDHALALPGVLKWHDLDDLAALLGSLADPAALAARSRQIRDGYLRLHRPAVFAETLDGILAGRGGVEDPDAERRDVDMLSGYLRNVVASLLPGGIAAAQEKRRRAARRRRRRRTP